MEHGQTSERGNDCLLDAFFRFCSSAVRDAGALRLLRASTSRCASRSLGRFLPVIHTLPTLSGGWFTGYSLPETQGLTLRVWRVGEHGDRVHEHRSGREERCMGPLSDHTSRSKQQ